MYTIVFTEDAKKDLKELHKKAPQAISKLSKLLDEIRNHPRTGTGQVEQLKGFDGSVYSRRITKEHRLIYKIYDDIVPNRLVSNVPWRAFCEGWFHQTPGFRRVW